jgi:hypothetical protein
MPQINIIFCRGPCPEASCLSTPYHTSALTTPGRVYYLQRITPACSSGDGSGRLRRASRSPAAGLGCCHPTCPCIPSHLLSRALCIGGFWLLASLRFVGHFEASLLCCADCSIVFFLWKLLASSMHWVSYIQKYKVGHRRDRATGVIEEGRREGPRMSNTEVQHFEQLGARQNAKAFILPICTSLADRSCVSNTLHS